MNTVTNAQLVKQRRRARFPYGRNSLVVIEDYFHSWPLATNAAPKRQKRTTRMLFCAFGQTVTSAILNIVSLVHATNYLAAFWRNTLARQTVSSSHTRNAYAEAAPFALVTIVDRAANYLNFCERHSHSAGWTQRTLLRDWMICDELFGAPGKFIALGESQPTRFGFKIKYSIFGALRFKGAFSRCKCLLVAIARIRVSCL